MNTIRMFAFAAAVLITALLFRVIADGFTAEAATHVATGARATGTDQRAQSAGD